MWTREKEGDETVGRERMGKREGMEDREKGKGRVD